MPEFKYAYWNDKKEAEPGYSKELLSYDIPANCDMDTMICYNYDGVDTIVKAFNRTVERIPNNDLFGTRVGDKYEWLTFKETQDQVRALAHGLMALDLCPAVQNEGVDWRFLGIQSKNRKEWCMLNLADAHQKITTVALYDTLGKEAMRYIINQTELTTVALSNDLIKKFCDLKVEDATMDE
jgi:long-chain acyl-CoA synthetase